MPTPSMISRADALADGAEALLTDCPTTPSPIKGAIAMRIMLLVTMLTNYSRSRCRAPFLAPGLLDGVIMRPTADAFSALFSSTGGYYLRYQAVLMIGERLTLGRFR